MKIRGQKVYEPKERLQRLIRIDKSGCWNWTSTKRNGYGRLVIGSRTDGSRQSISAHRYSWIVYKGEIPDGMFVCHKCDNKACVNPDHLFLGTRQDNVDDREIKDRNNHVIGEKVGTSKLTKDEVLEIYNSKLSSRKLGRRYGVNKSTILDIKNRKTWSHILPDPPDECKTYPKTIGNAHEIDTFDAIFYVESED